jgi:hypothetical protein
MIKCTGQAPATSTQPSRPMALFGVDAENIRRLQAGQPIRIELADVGLPPMMIVLVYGEDEAALVRTLAPLIDADTVIRDAGD